MHPLDTHDRRELAQGAAGIGDVQNITKCCTEVCPEGIKITDNVIIPMKERVVDKKFDPLGVARQQDRRPQQGLRDPAPATIAAGLGRLKTSHSVEPAPPALLSSAP